MKRKILSEILSEVTPEIESKVEQKTLEIMEATKENSFIDLSKLSEGEIIELENILDIEITRDSIWVILFHNGKKFDFSSKNHWSLKHKTEITYSDFIRLFEDGEENNGWIKIESQADLPQKSGDYFLSLKEGIYVRMDYWDVHSSNFKKNDKDSVSHYQPITKPLPPKF